MKSPDTSIKRGEEIYGPNPITMESPDNRIRWAASYTSDHASHRTWGSQLLGPSTKKKEETNLYDLATQARAPRGATSLG